MLEVREISKFALAGFSASSAVFSQRRPRFRTLLFLKFIQILKRRDRYEKSRRVRGDCDRS